MQPQALTRIDGAVLGVRKIDLPAQAATRDEATGRETREARPASTLYEVDVASTFARYDGGLHTGLTAVHVVTYADTDKRPGPGEVVSVLCFPWVSVSRTRTGWFRRVAHRYVADVPASAAAPATRSAA